MDQAEYDNFVDQEKLAAAASRQMATAERLARAEADLAAAKRTHERAEKVSVRAIEGQGDLSPMEAEIELGKASTSLTVATKVHVSAAEAHRKALARMPVEKALAHVPLYIEGIRQRIAAARKADAARALLVEADSEHQAATELQQNAVAAGVPHTGYAHTGPRQVVSEAQEVALWTSHGVDLERGTLAWDPGPA